MKTLLAITAVCCLAVSSAFPLYGHPSIPLVKGSRHAFCPTHGRFGAHLGFDGQLHGDRFEQLGLVGYYGNYQNARDGGFLGPAIGGFNNDFNNDIGFDNFDRGFDNGILGNDDIALGVGPFRRRSMPSFSIGGDDYTRGPIESSVRSTRPVGGLPPAPIQRATRFGTGRGIQGGFVPRNDFNNGFDDFNNGFSDDGFINNDLSLIHDQISH